MPRGTSAKTVLKHVRRLERHLNRLKIMPATRLLRSAVILALLSKALTVSGAICALIDAGYPAEAFAMSRTLLEILFSVRYITNKETEKRARQYVKYDARVRAEWMNIIQKHFPKSASKLGPIDATVLQTAKEFKSKAHWTGEGGQAKMMATEEDTVELDEHGKGFKAEFDYDGLYFWTSQYVHATVAGIRAHSCTPGEIFKVRARSWEDEECARDALFVTAVTLCKLFVHACRSLHEDQPAAIQDLHKMISKFARKKGKS